MLNSNTQKFAFILGREQEICLSELKSVLNRFCFSFDIYRISGNTAFAKVENFSREDAKSIIEVLGGTIKIFELVDSLGNNISKQIADLISKEKEGSENKINFGVSCFNKKITTQQIGSFALKAKKSLKGKFSLRFVESRDGAELSSILTLKNNLVDKGIEIGIFDQEIGVLVALNNPEEWGKRDYDKPAFDKYSGMVPPKLARMMVDIALGEIGNSKLETRNSKQILNQNEKNSKQVSDFVLGASDLKRSIVLDCFCGSGNILLEALMLGCDVVGSDISPKAVQDTEENIKWLLGQIIKKQETITKQITNYNPPAGGQIPNIKIFQADATSDSLLENLKMVINKYDRIAIVAEPFLGQPKKFKPTYNSAKGEYDKIKELYLGFLRNIAVLLNGYIADGSSAAKPSNNTTIQQPARPAGGYNNCILCLVFPVIETSDKGRYSLFKESVDEIKELGYTQIRPTMIYGREYQVVKREIALLKL